MLLYVCCVFFLLGFGNSHAISDEMLEMAKMLHDSCVSETGVDEGIIEKCRDGVFTEDSKLKCYIKCIMDQVSGMTDDGEIDEETVISMLPEEMQPHVAPTIRECGTVRGSDNCDTAFQTHKCYYNKNPEIKELAIFHINLKFGPCVPRGIYHTNRFGFPVTRRRYKIILI